MHKWIGPRMNEVLKDGSKEKRKDGQRTKTEWWGYRKKEGTNLRLRKKGTKERTD